MNPNDIKHDKYYIFEGAQLLRLVKVAKRLYTEDRMNGDEMRDNAQIIFDGVLSNAIQWPEEE